MIRFENVLKRSLQDVLKTSWRRLQNVLNKSWRCLEDVLKTSWRRLENVLKTSWRRMTKTSILVLIKTSSEDVWVRRIYSSWSRRLQDVLKTSSEEEDERRLQEFFKTSSSRRMFAGLFLAENKTIYKLHNSYFINESFHKTWWHRQFL